MSLPEPTDPREIEVRTLALSYPEAHEDHPWGERAFKVRGKTFLFMSNGDWGFNLSMKLPISGPAALEVPNVAPTGYNLGKSGWVTVKHKDGQKPDMELIREWVDESYRTVAPKKLVAQLDGAPPTKPVKSSPKRKPPV